MNQVAFDFIKAREGCRLSAYQDSAGVWTIGYGQTGAGIGPGTVWTQAQADATLMTKVAGLETALSLKLNAKLSLQQMAALISLAYNIGAYALATSHVFVFVQARNWLAAAKAMLQWDHAGGVELQGLFKRRCEEAALFLEGSN